MIAAIIITARCPHTRARATPIAARLRPPGRDIEILIVFVHPRTPLVCSPINNFARRTAIDSHRLVRSNPLPPERGRAGRTVRRVEKPTRHSPRSIEQYLFVARTLTMIEKYTRPVTLKTAVLVRPRAGKYLRF